MNVWNRDPGIVAKRGGGSKESTDGLDFNHGPVSIPLGTNGRSQSLWADQPKSAAMIALIQAQIWKIAAIVSALLALSAVGSCAVTSTRLHNAQNARDKLERSITAPETGWAARLSQCRANTAALTEATQRQNAAIEAAASQSRDRLHQAETAVSRAQADERAARQKLSDLMRPLQEIDECRRFQEADRRGLEDLT